MDEYVSWRALRQFVTVGDETLAYIRTGTPGKPSLVLVHGWMSHGRVWRSTMETLKDDYDCIAVDLYGFGFSDKKDGTDYSIAAQARRILALADALGLETFDLMGHSMGGGIVLLLAAEHPERVRKVIDVGGVVTGKLTPYVRFVLAPTVRMGYYIPMMWSVGRIGFRRWPWYKHFYADNAMTYKRDVIMLGGEDILMGVVSECEVGSYHALDAINHIDLTEKMKTLSIPTLIIFGNQDNTVPVSEAHYAHRMIPDSRLILYEQCGHSPMIELPKQFMSDVKEFLDD